MYDDRPIRFIVAILVNLPNTLRQGRHSHVWNLRSESICVRVCPYWSTYDARCACVNRRSTTFSWRRRHISASRSLSHVSRPKLPQMRSDSVARQRMTSRRVSSSNCNSTYFVHIPLGRLTSSHGTGLLHDEHTHAEMLAMVAAVTAKFTQLQRQLSYISIFAISVITTNGQSTPFFHML